MGKWWKITIFKGKTMERITICHGKSMERTTIFNAVFHGKTHELSTGPCSSSQTVNVITGLGRWSHGLGILHDLSNRQRLCRVRLPSRFWKPPQASLEFFQGLWTIHHSYSFIGYICIYIYIPICRRYQAYTIGVSLSVNPQIIHVWDWELPTSQGWNPTDPRIRVPPRVPPW